MELWQLPAWRITEAVVRGELSVSEVVETHLARLRTHNPEIFALLTVTEKEALRRAAELDERHARGEEPGLLAGVPVVLKDNMCTRGVRTTCGSRMLENWIPPYDASVVTSLEAAGAVILGKANMDEFAMGSSTEHSAFGFTANPWDLSRVPGGSSGGSAAAVAAGFAPLALGSDTGGSIRQPAAFCGVHGLKPTYGLVSRYGLVAFASSLDQIGPFARDVGDLALALDAIAAPDPKDATCGTEPRPRYLDAMMTDSLRGKRIGLVKEFSGFDVDPELRNTLVHAARVCQDAGAELVDISLPVTIGFGLACYYILAPAEASSNLARYDGVRYGLRAEGDTLLEQYFRTRGAGFGKEVKRRILTGTYVLSSGYYDAYYLTAQKVRRRIVQEFAQVFSGVDAILLPTSPCLPFRRGELVDDPIRMYLTDVFTLPVNLAGLPGLSLCTGYAKNGLPLSVQLVGKAWSEQQLLGTAAVLESRFGTPRIAPLETKTHFKGGERL
jgi:aspartyl-tRNA(Asn)/glutamyl-tRNA(Gln) amidotransferase subunit A